MPKATENMYKDVNLVEPALKCLSKCQQATHNADNLKHSFFCFPCFVSFCPSFDFQALFSVFQKTAKGYME